ncbi:MAG: hypothetical protein UX02_C0003G0011 [Candidatus Moranbacteria bacterium GW2011_GWC1_45_18]|nr:MAG: hypothetical protein UT79_C0004G0011 [Candidatus Moranbacteria bacterium GW2011_GWC2_40_12]KKT33620.1 MAG: hypothetical protein UW19_C0007G0011 [Candidatus Moranbacteria bacterium GW2011_GWF2_44_10]KKT99468.1 MAG: hypothetical protein UX02_C0003G0011 [Candidatus Moranbacteria bacterium GW2011_GWC1_45_18]OGI22376.1 MAG: hypothetical protein A2194_00980 [Candidatus Moranbacteria bacterium RIFOXYA1_FULL_44_8]OGI42221.1 MAG: hypothetical protein A2593_00445 [Candidatus Moranbacteria bacteri
MTRISMTPVTDWEFPIMRWFFFFGWTGMISGCSWLLWYYKLPPMPASILWPIGLTILSVPIAWILGWKLLIGPLFCGFMARHKS